jgi:UDP-2-acetamido-3-amino-2,3-dideoxy-glucuronate N-acetyltransferase
MLTAPAAYGVAESPKGSVMSVRIAPTADVDPSAVIGSGSAVWHLAQIREDAQVGDGCVVGRGAYIGPGVRVGDNCKIQNYALVYEPAVVADGVFIGPAVVFTNDHFPRAVNPDGTLKSAEDWTAVGVTVREGAAVGARAVCVAPITIGRWALIAAGSTVTRDVPDYALMAGAPAKRIGWVGRAGVPLERGEQDRWVCPESGQVYQQVGEHELVEATN